MLSSSQNVVITGIANGVKGRRLQLFNVGNYPIILSHESLDSIAANRFRFQTGFASAIEPDTNLTVYYYKADQRWVAGTEILDIAGRWTSRTCPTGQWNDVVWAEALGLFVAVGTGPTNYVMTSPDGIVWTAQTAPAPGGGSTGWLGVTWSEDLNLLVAVGTGTTNRIITSPDGINWTAQTPAFSTTLYSVAWSPSLGMFVICGGDHSTSSTSNKIMTSTNGTVWTAQTSALTAGWFDIVWSPELAMFVVVGESGTNAVATSTNGTAWTGRYNSATDVGCIVWSPELGVFVSGFSFSSGGLISYDGINWSNPGGVPRMTDVAWSPELGIFLSVDTFSSSYYSISGLTWVAGSTIVTNGICWSSIKNTFVSVGNNLVYTSP